MKKKFILLSLILVMLLGACASTSVAPTESMIEIPSYAPMAEDKQASYDEAGTESAGASAQEVERLVIKTASIRVAVADAADSMTAVTELASAMGGYVVSSNVWNNTSYEGVTYTQSSILIRVPAEKLDESMARIRAMAANAEDGVLSESISGEDVTSDFVDSQSRLSNLEAAEAQLVELLDSATSLEYTMEIFRELTNIRSQIEVLKGHIKYLSESAAMSSISVELVPEISIQPIQIGPWKPAGVAKEAIQGLAKAAQKVGTGLIWFLIAWVPFLLPIGIIIYFIAKGSSKRKARRAERRALAKEAKAAREAKTE